MASRRRCSPRAAPLDNDDLLSEILLILPPQPSSLPRASHVCKRWRRLVSDPGFLRRFRVHHRRNPPLLGFFETRFYSVSFVPALMAPDRVPCRRFSFPWGDVRRFSLLNCRHGLVLISDQTQRQFIVWDPVTGDQHRVSVPAPVDTNEREINGAVLRAAGDVHFQVVFVATRNDGIEHGQEALASVYSSETGVWGNSISTPTPFGWPSRSIFGTDISTKPAVLVGNSLYWTLIDSGSSCIIEYDLEKQSLVVIEEPEELCGYDTVIRADSGGLGFLYLSEFAAQLWERKTDCDGVASWWLGRTIELDKLLHLNPPPIPDMDHDTEQDDEIRILGFAEENNMVFVGTWMGLFVVQLQSLRFKRLSATTSQTTLHCHPLESVYTQKQPLVVNMLKLNFCTTHKMSAWSDMLL